MGPKCEGIDIATMKLMVMPRSVETKSVCFFRKSWIFRRQSWEDRDTPCSTAPSQWGASSPPNSTCHNPRQKGKEEGDAALHSWAAPWAALLFSAACCNLGRQTAAVYFLLLQHTYDFLGMMHFGLRGMYLHTGKGGHTQAFFFPPTGEWKEGSEKMEKQSTL